MQLAMLAEQVSPAQAGGVEIPDGHDPPSGSGPGVALRLALLEEGGHALAGVVAGEVAEREQIAFDLVAGLDVDVQRVVDLRLDVAHGQGRPGGQLDEPA